jgi:hypothetical protein
MQHAQILCAIQRHSNASLSDFAKSRIYPIAEIQE